MNRKTFCDLFCEAHYCLPEQFNETVLWWCIPPQALSLARQFKRLNPDYFQPELELIEQIKELTDPTEIEWELTCHFYHTPPHGISRGFLKVRLSGQRLMDLVNGLFAQARTARQPFFAARPVFSPGRAPAPVVQRL